MKKLLILGGSRYILPVIKAAHELGCYVITCDYLPDNIAHKYSDRYLNISIIDKEAVLDAARELKIDGIMSFACDPGVVPAAYVADRLGLPSPGPYESVCILQNKGKFRKFLKDNDFNVPEAERYTNISDALKDIGRFKWPVIVKPTDSAGSKGVTKDLKKSIEYALSFSHCDEFIIEEFIEQKGYSSDTDSFSVDGELKFVSFSSQHFDKSAANPYTPAAYHWPTSMSEAHQAELTSEIQRLLKLLKMRTSIYNIETRESLDEKAYIMEISPRGGGNRLAEMIKYTMDVDLITNSVRAAIGEKTVDIVQKPYNGYWSDIILHSNRNGKFKKLWISDDIKDNIVETDLWVKPGEYIGSFEGANASIGMIVFKHKTENEMISAMRNRYDLVKVIVE